MSEDKEKLTELENRTSDLECSVEKLRNLKIEFERTEKFAMEKYLYLERYNSILLYFMRSIYCNSYCASYSSNKDCYIITTSKEDI